MNSSFETITDREAGLRREVVEVTRLAASQGLLRSSDGNVSARLDSGRLLVTPSGKYKLCLEPEDLLIVDLEGRVLGGRPGLRPTSEILMHLEAYRQRPDIGAALHAHPPYATALTIAGLSFPVDIIPEVLLALGEVPVAPYATPGTQDLADSIRPFILEHNTILLSHHGSLSVSNNLKQALIDLERLEQTSYVYYLARGFGNVVTLPAQEVQRLRAIGKQRK